MDTQAATTLRASRRRLLGGAAALGLAAPLAGTLGAPAPVQAQADPATLTIAMNGTPSDLDPHSAYDYRSAIALRGPYEQLIALKGSATDEYEGLIAESWESNADKSVWTFRIRPGVTFHDGTPVDAEAVRASFERFLTLAIGPYTALLRFVPDPSRITAPDPMTVVFDCGKPQPLFESYLTSQYGPIVMNTKAAMAQEVDGDLGHGWAMTNQEGLGTGPYRIVAFEPGQQLEMERYEGYWRGWEGNHFQRVVIRVVPENETRRQLIESGDVDIVDNLTPEALQAMEQNPDLVVDKSYSAEVDYLMLTVAGPLATPEARQALCYAFPYDEVVQGVYKGYGKRAIGPVAEVVRGHDPATFTYPTDLAKARELLAAAGVPEGTEVTLMQESGDENVKTAVQLFQANLTEIGLSLNVTTVDLATFTATVFGDAPAEERPMVMPWFWWPDYNDAWNHLYPQISCEAWGSKGTNSGYYCNGRVGELLNASRDEPDPAKYQAALSEIQQIVTRDDPAAIYYLQRQWTTILRKQIQGFVFNPINIGTYDFYRLSRSA
jgi:peptide/nickel transport system substrate-binding protein